MAGYHDWGTWYAGMRISDSINPMIQTDNTNRQLLGVVVRQYSKLMEHKVNPRLVVKAIVIARDRMQNYVDNGGSMAKTVEVSTDSKGDRTSVTARALQKRVNKLVEAHAEEIAAFDSAEKVRIAQVYEASKKRRGY